MFRILGIDYGLKRIGLSLSDLLQITASPFKTIFNTDTKVEEITDIINSQNVQYIVIGKPDQTKSNTEFMDSLNIFAEDLSKISSLNYEYWDESYSSKKAFNKMIESGKKKKFRRKKTNLDAFAAAEILTDYLNYREK
ncbi:Holliday junction resolvase RuvX [Candidatus Kapabacteria bacterium]|nr:Holliday junction resolvase RuvX [Candidatus Kapabacteria bacterium]